MDDILSWEKEPEKNGAAELPVEEAAASDEEVRLVKDLLQLVVKTKRAFEMYPSNNPILQKFQEDLVKKFDSFFATENRLTLSIRQHDVYYKGLPVYHNPNKDDNIALLFYKDGLRELTFTAGFTGDEITDFLEVIRVRPESSVESYDDDVVTLLWEKDFLHLTYYVVEEYVEGSALDDDEVAKLLEQRRSSSEEGDLVEAYQDAESEGENKEVFTPLETVSLGLRGVFSLGEEEVKSLKEEMETLTDHKFLQNAVDILFETLYIDQGTPDFNILMDNLDSALGYLMTSGQFGMAALVLKRFRELESQATTFNPKEIARIKASLARPGSEASLKKVADMLNSGRDVGTDEFKLLLSQLDKSSIIPLSGMMGEIQDVKYRKALIEALVALGRGSTDVLVTALKDKRWQVVRNIVAILGRIGDKSAVEHLKLALAHPEPNVRREAVRSLGMIGGPKAGDSLLLAIEDADPQIRMAAMRFLPRAQSFAVLDSLMEIITRSDFIERALAEKRAVFEVLAEIGQDRVLPFMVKLLKKKGLFDSAKKEEVRAGAAYGLGNINQQVALDTLNKELPRAKKGSVLSEAISYSIHKLNKPPERPTEVIADNDQ